MRVLAKNIVVLVYAKDPNCVRPVPLPEAHEGIEVHCGTGEWKRNGQNFKVGEHRPLTPDGRQGVIGVYDKSNPSHVDAMLRVMYQATCHVCADCCPETAS